MTVAELLGKILAAYPGASPEAMATFKPVFYARFQHREGERLEAAAAEVFASFRATSRNPFPIPADFEGHMPSMPKGGEGPRKLDMKAHDERKARLLDEWRKTQGHRGANGVAEVLQALQFIAEPVAHLLAWDDTTEPLRLTMAQLRLAQHRAISLQRRVEFGDLPRSNEEWWEQISGIAARWGIATSYDDWAPKKQTKEAA